jgi:hypothetical protein
MNIRLLCVLALVGGIASAQTGATPAAQPETKPAPAPAAQPDPMSGPKVEPKPGEPTLIKHDFNGHLMPTAIPPEEAALDLIGLDAGEKEAVNAILSQRAAVLDNIVSENLPLLLKLQGVRKGDNQTEQMQAIKDLYKAFAPLRDMGSLRQQVILVIGADKATKYNQLLNEYWQSIMQEAIETEKIRGKTPTESEVKGKWTLLVAGQEIHRSYDRQIAAKSEQLNDLLAKLNATPEQDAKIRALTSDYFQKTLGKPTAAQRRELFRGILKELNEDQRMVLLQELYAEHGDTKKPDEKKPEEKKPDEKK